MKMHIKKIFDDILEKKFSKTMTAGYDPLEVDMFLDKIRSFLITVSQVEEELEKDIKRKNEEILDLKKTIKTKISNIKFLENQIESYKADGYQSQKIIKDLGKLEKELNELKNNGRKKK
ncbi:MAG: DivIVA domain-containing protein [Mycoplasma sp.]|nr:DivIVA domain-containing protein [Mycoplasma sp.]